MHGGSGKSTPGHPTGAAAAAIERRGVRTLLRKVVSGASRIRASAAHAVVSARKAIVVSGAGVRQRQVAAAVVHRQAISVAITSAGGADASRAQHAAGHVERSEAASAARNARALESLTRNSLKFFKPLRVGVL